MAITPPEKKLGILGGIEMDTILAVAIGGNALGGGTFSVAGSVIGAYTIEILNRTLLRLGIEPEPIKVYKALFIILLMCMSSPVIKDYLSKAWASIGASRRGKASVQKGGN